jgi:DNA sulfur modification protein DndB
MLTNVAATSTLQEYAKHRGELDLQRTIPLATLKDALAHGWSEEKKLKKESVRISKAKPSGIRFADRIWLCLHKMDFHILSNDYTTQLHPEINTSFGDNPLDIVCLDGEVGLGVFLKTSPQPRPSDSSFLQDLQLYEKARSAFSHSINQMKPDNVRHTLKTAFIVFTLNIVLSEEEKQFARTKNILLFNEHDLAYYETLIEHLGSSAKYQLLADVFAEKEISGLTIEIPAICLHAGKLTYYSFAIHPAYLLKISYLAHHKPGQPADIFAYQRMTEKKRLAEMREYIREAGVFPTNIVLCLKAKPYFEPLKLQDRQKIQKSGASSGELGILRLKSFYRSAWIIDGQHRLFSYSGEPRATNSHIAVLAFEDLSPERQAAFFLDINGKQKPVSKEHILRLQEQMHKDAIDLTDRLLALIPQAITCLDEDKDSPFYQRILAKETKRRANKTISWETLQKIMADDIFLKPKSGMISLQPDDEAIIERIVLVFTTWFVPLAETVAPWWKAGANSRSGGLSTNNGISVCLLVLKGVVQHLMAQANDLAAISNQELHDVLRPYANSFAEQLSSLSEQERQAFRERSRSNQGRLEQADYFLKVL